MRPSMRVSAPQLMKLSARVVVEVVAMEVEVEEVVEASLNMGGGREMLTAEEVMEVVEVMVVEEVASEEVASVEVALEVAAVQEEVIRLPQAEEEGLEAVILLHREVIQPLQEVVEVEEVEEAIQRQLEVIQPHPEVEEAILLHREVIQPLQEVEEVEGAIQRQLEATQHPPGVVEVAIPPPRGGGSLFPPLEVTTISNYYTILKLHLHHVCLAIFDF